MEAIITFQSHIKRSFNISLSMVLQIIFYKYFKFLNCEFFIKNSSAILASSYFNFWLTYHKFWLRRIHNEYFALCICPFFFSASTDGHFGSPGEAVSGGGDRSTVRVLWHRPPGTEILGSKCVTHGTDHLLQVLSQVYSSLDLQYNNNNNRA